jgi:hypothetical protein
MSRGIHQTVDLGRTRIAIQLRQIVLSVGGEITICDLPEEELLFLNREAATHGEFTPM